MVVRLSEYGDLFFVKKIAKNIQKNTKNNEFCQYYALVSLKFP